MEASLLSKLGEHDNVIQMYGAVLDEQESDFQPPRVYKMMMELAERESGREEDLERLSEWRELISLLEKLGFACSLNFYFFIFFRGKNLG